MPATDAARIWNSLRGLICVYKPPDVNLLQFRSAFLYKICAELNQLEGRKPRQHVFIEGDPAKNLDVIVKPSLADVPMVVGPRYQIEDVPCSWSNYLGSVSSGVLCIRNGTKLAKKIRENKPLRAYRIKGTLGQARDKHFKHGAVVEKSTYKHIKLKNLETLLSYMQASHQRKMFEVSGVDVQSQTAYELAVQGPIRPLESKIPIIYGIRCVTFELPHFVIEVHCVNEYESYLMALIHEIGMKLNSAAYCTGIQCIRQAYFTLDHALLQRQWTIENIVANMEQCAQIIDENENLLLQTSAILK